MIVYKFKLFGNADFKIRGRQWQKLWHSCRLLMLKFYKALKYKK